jgi:hypothetical protein
MKFQLIDWITIDGVNKNTLKWLTWAKKKARFLYENGTRNDNWISMPDGTLVKIQIIDENCFINIKGIGVVKNPYLSGMQEIASVVYTGGELGGYAAQFYPARDNFPKNTETSYLIDREWFKYGTLQNYIWPPHDPDPDDKNYTSREDYLRALFIEKWVVKSRPNLPDEDTGYTDVPALFTGKMRKVQQKIWAYRRSNPFGVNCGLYTPNYGEGLDCEKQRWIIDIRNNGAIYAYQVSFIKEIDPKLIVDLTQDQQDRYDFGLIDNYTIPTEFISPSAWKNDKDRNKKGIVLMPEYGSLYDIIADKSPITNWHSTWAFSYTGHEAQAVLVGEDQYGVSDLLWKSYRYKIIINEDEEGIPYEALISLEESDYLWTVKIPPAPLQDHPLSSPINSPFCEFIYYFRPDNNSSGNWPSSHDAPLYAYYNSNNEIQVLRHKYSDIEYLSDDVYLDPNNSYYGIFWTTPWKSSGSGNTAKHWNRHNYTHDQRTRYTNCYYMLDEFPVTEDTSYRVSVDEEYGFGNYVSTMVTFFHYRGASNVLGNAVHYNGYYASNSAHLVYNTHYEQIGIPPFNRECIFYYRNNKNTVNSHTFLEHHAEYGNGPEIYTNGWVSRGGVKVPGSDFTFGGYGSAGSAVGGVYSSTAIPQNITTSKKFMCYTSQHDPINLDYPDDDEYWYSQLYQIYSADIGAFSGSGAILPWPRTDTGDIKLDKASINNGASFISMPEDSDALDYPVNKANQYISGELSYPLLVMIGDDNTTRKPIDKVIRNTDIEAIQYKL